MEERSLELKKAGLAIPKVLEQNRLLLPYHLYQAKRDWKQIADEQIAKYSYILDFKDKQVIIAAGEGAAAALAAHEYLLTRA